jgi:5-oxoprolinase (ATP-hydrolysing)
VSPLPKLVTRGDTTLVDAYLSPVLDRYVASVRSGLAADLRGAPLLFRQSHGGLAAAEHFHGKDSLLSGPAGGVVGMVHAAREAGYGEAIGFDMGGTSTDVALFAGALERTADARIAGVRGSAPMLLIQTVAAGGGSILKFGNGRLQVGPESAGAFPGPACYRNGGPPTVTDANLFLGRIQPDFFPRVFGPAGDEPLDTDAAAAAFATLADTVADATGERLGTDALAAGYLRIAVERMANAIKQISVQRGHDITRFALLSFGGAGGQHACQLADSLGVRTVLIHPLAGVLSAYGIGVADLRVVRQLSIEAPLAASLHATLPAQFAALGAAARTNLAAQSADLTRLRFEQRARVKVAGADASLLIDWAADAALDALRGAFHAAHARHFGFRAADDALLVVESIEIEGIVPGVGERTAANPVPQTARTAQPAAVRSVWCDDGRRDLPVYERSALGVGAVVPGPAIIAEANATTVLEVGWEAAVHASGTLRLTRARPAPGGEIAGTQADPIMLEVFNNSFMHVAEEMGIVLENTAHSVNIKERLDFSCALFDADGALIANAPHIPVHLGSMGDSVQSVLRSKKLAPGDSYLLNTPYNGGTHLPDLTVVTPVFGGPNGRLRYVVASRAHHADIGGITPGSMPPHSRTCLTSMAIFIEGMQMSMRLNSRCASG